MENLKNENASLIIYYDEDNYLCIVDKQNNTTFRIVPTLSNHGIELERFENGELKSKNHLSVDELHILSNLAGCNYLLKDLKGGEQIEQNWEKEFDKLFPSVYKFEPTTSSQVNMTDVTNQLKTYVKNLVKYPRTDWEKQFDFLFSDLSTTKYEMSDSSGTITTENPAADIKAFIKNLFKYK